MNESSSRGKDLREKPGVVAAEEKVQESGFSEFMNWVIEIPIYLVVIILPFFFLDNVPSPLELNKQIVLVGLVGLSFLAWVGKMAWKNEIRLKRSFLFIPILTFLFIYALSTVFSDYYEQSMWGYFGGENKALVSVLFFVAFFVLVYNNIKNHKTIARFIASFVISGLFLTLLGVFQFFEIYLLPFEFAKAKFFNPVGSAYVFSLYIAVVFLVSVTLFLGKFSKIVKLLLLFLSFLSFFILIVVNFKMLWIVLLIMLALILGMTILIEDKNPSQSRIIPMIFLVLTLFFILRSKPLLNNSELPMEIFIKHKTAAKISLNSIKKNPLLGSGPTTFANVYKQNRPSNLGDFSVVNFNESTSFFFTLASTTGILGIASFLFVVVSGLIISVRNIASVISGDKKKENVQKYLGLSVSVGWLFLTIFLFLYFTNISILMLWWLFFALMTAVSFLNKKQANQSEGEITTTSNSPKTSFFLSFGFVLIIIGFIAVIYLQSQKYIAAVYFQQALVASAKENDLEKTADRISRAVSLDPNRDSYYRDLALVHLAFAKEKIVEKGIQNLTPEESNYVSTRFRTALQSLNQAKKLNPSNSLNLLSVANLYEEFIVIQKDSGEKAIENYQGAIELDPKNPEIYQSLANVYITLADIETIEANSSKKVGDKFEIPDKAREYFAMAEDYLTKALVIKPDHVGSNLLLVTVYEKGDNVEKAIEKSKKNIEIYPNSADLLVNLGRIYYQNENLDEAEKYFQKALTYNSRYANALYLLGLTLDKKGDKQGALVEFEKIKENNPDNELLDKIINNLKSGQQALSGIGDSEAQENISEINADSTETSQEENQNLTEGELENQDKENPEESENTLIEE